MQNPTAQWLDHQFRKAVRRIARRPSVFAPTPTYKATSTRSSVPCRPALFNPDHFSRVTKCAFNATLDQLHAVLTADHYVESPLEIHEMRNATVIGGVIFNDHAPVLHSKFVNASFSDTFASAPVMEEAILINSMAGLRYFGHWLGDDTSAFEALRDQSNFISLPLPPWANAPVYADLFDHNWSPQMVARSRKLTLVRDLGFSSQKADRYRILRKRLRTNFGPGKDNRSKVVYIRRGASGDPRPILNSSELEQRLTAAGVSIVTAEDDTRKLISEILDAALIITVEGSQNRHAIYNLRDGGGVLTLAPPDRFYVAFHEWVRSLDMYSGLVIGNSTENGFTINPDEVLMMADSLMTQVEASKAS